MALWQKVVALAPLLLLAVYLPGQVMLRCRIDGQLRAICCCPHAGEASGSGPVMKAQDCCDREMTASDRPVVEAARSSGLDVTWAIAVALPTAPASSLATPDRPTSRRHAQDPPRGGPPLVLAKHAFLI